MDAMTTQASVPQTFAAHGLTDKRLREEVERSVPTVQRPLCLVYGSGVAHGADTAILHQRLDNHLAQRWQEPDEGIWEIRGARRHFVRSAVMASVALDRAIRVELRATIHHKVCAQGYDPLRNTYH
jgi:hypothetical protein